MHVNNDGYPLHSEDIYASSAGPAFGITDIVGTLRREWWLPVFGCLIGLLLAVCYIVFVPTTSLYTSSARILLDRSVNRFLQSNKIADAPTFFDETESQVYVLSSESIVLPVIRSMNLIGDSEFAGSPNAQGPQVLTGTNKLIALFKQYIGWNNKTLIEPEAMLERTVVETFLKRLTVNREDVPNVISITFASESSTKAASIANAIADSYIATTLGAKTQSNKVVSQWLQDRMIELRSQAEDADRALQNFKITNNLAATGKTSLNSEQLSALNTAATNARIAMTEAKARLDRIQKMTSDGTTSATAIDTLKNETRDVEINPALSNDNILKLRSQYLDLARKASEIQSLVGPGHAAVTKLHKRMDDLRTAIQDEERHIAASYVDEYQIAKARGTEIAANMTELLGEAATSSEAQSKMRELESAADTLRTLYNSFLQRFKEVNTNQTETIQAQGAHILTRAAPPLHKSSKKVVVVFGGSLMLGLFLGAGAAIAKEWMADVFRTPNLVKQITEIDCLIAPIVKANRATVSLQGSKGSMPIEEYVLAAPYSRFAETLRGVKALVNVGHHVQGVKVIGVVSSLPKEGKTTIAANLAALMVATSGARTLIIDGDLHLRLLTARLAPDAREGLIEALVDPSRLATLVCKKQRSGLDVLPCVLPARIPNAAELLGSPQMEQLLIAARKSYDYIVIEIAPIMSVVDVKMIERFIDRFIFVVEWGQTKRSAVLEALSEAHDIRDRIICMILNKADPVALRSIEAYKGNRFKDYYQG